MHGRGARPERDYHEQRFQPAFAVSGRAQTHAAPYAEAAAALSARASVVTLNALGPEPRDKLKAWCKPGQSVAFLGSSGVGKSTLVNALLADARAQTAPIRNDDAKGRHTTTHRQLHLLENGCALLDLPGMRELQLAETQDGIADLFDDLSALSGACRFSDCTHEAEPGCAVQAALARGDLSDARLARWRKLQAEDRFNAASLAERKSRDKALHKRVRAAQKHKNG